MVAASISFTQSSTGPGAGLAMIGAVGAFTIANGDNTGVENWLIEVVDAPEGSAVTPGILVNGPTPTATITADVTGGYEIHLVVEDRFGNFAEDWRVFQVPETNGDIVPPFGADDRSMNFAGQTLGWKTYANRILKRGSTSGTIIGTAAARPAATAVSSGTTYFATDTLVFSISDHVSWRAITSASQGTISRGLYASRPAAGTATSGAVYIATDTAAIYFSDGVGWFPLGPIVSLTAPPKATNWTLVNAGVGTTLTDRGDAILLSDFTSGGNENSHLAFHPTPIAAGAAYTFIAHYIGTLDQANNATCGIAIGDATPKLSELVQVFNTGGELVQVARKTNPTTFSANPYSVASNYVTQYPGMWMRIQSAGGVGNRTYSTSSDGGQTWRVVLTESASAFLTETRVGIVVNPINSAGASLLLDHCVLTFP